MGIIRSSRIFRMRTMIFSTIAWKSFTIVSISSSPSSRRYSVCRPTSFFWWFWCASACSVDVKVAYIISPVNRQVRSNDSCSKWCSLIRCWLSIISWITFSVTSTMIDPRVNIISFMCRTFVVSFSPTSPRSVCYSPPGYCYSWWSIGSFSPWTTIITIDRFGIAVYTMSTRSIRPCSWYLSSVFSISIPSKCWSIRRKTKCLTIQKVRALFTNTACTFLVWIE